MLGTDSSESTVTPLNSWYLVMESDVPVTLPKPVFLTLARDLSKIYCEACLRSWKKRETRNALTIGKHKFETLARKRELVDQHYNKVIKRVDWSREEMLCCRSCYSVLFKEDYLGKQKVLEVNLSESLQIFTPLESTPPPQ